MTSLNMLMNFHVNFTLTNSKVGHTSENGRIFNEAIIIIIQYLWLPHIITPHLNITITWSGR
jgi:hypothetical protein